VSEPYFATRAGLPQGSCFDCAFWAYQAGQDLAARGICTACSGKVPESVVRIDVLRRNPENPIGFEPLPEVERRDYHGVLVTPRDFSCSSWVLHPEATDEP
jgi:hypothetical protein